MAIEAITSNDRSVGGTRDEVFDWGRFPRRGENDAFWWKAKGTGGSQYTYRVRQTISTP